MYFTAAGCTLIARNQTPAKLQLWPLKDEARRASCARTPQFRIGPVYASADTASRPAGKRWRCIVALLLLERAHQQDLRISSTCRANVHLVRLSQRAG